MTVAEQVVEESLAEHCRETAAAAQDASRTLATTPKAVKNAVLYTLADGLTTAAEEIFAANRKDLDAAAEHGLTEAQIDRLRLDGGRIAAVAAGVREIAALPDPVGEVLDETVRPNGLRIRRLRVPLGVVLFLYESRPNVTVDAAALCLKSGNAVILRGGKEAAHSNAALAAVVADALKAHDLPTAAVANLSGSDRQAVAELLKLDEFIDVAIPRGGKSLIERVVAGAAMPVLKHYDGNCHVYVDGAAELAMAVAIVVNGKTQRPGVCNATESLLVHEAVAADFLPTLAERLSGVELRGCPRTLQILPGATAADEADWSAEYLGPVLSVKVVGGVEEAVAHVNAYGSGHTDAIVTADESAAAAFTAGVDSAAVMVNASTRFNDGAAFGLGAEIGISTDKLHARGPCGLRELTSYKYVVHGAGQVRT